MCGICVWHGYYLSACLPLSERYFIIYVNVEYLMINNLLTILVRAGIDPEGSVVSYKAYKNFYHTSLLSVVRVLAMQ